MNICYCKKLFTFFLGLIICLSAGAQNVINKIDKNGKKQGPWKKYENGVLVYEGQFENDVPQGTFKYFFPDGKLKSVSEFLKGVSKVKVTTYHPNGKTASEGIFIDQLKDGKWQYFSEKGVSLSVENYKMGKKNGDFITYSTDGYKLKEEHFTNDIQDGVCRTYYEKEELFTETNYVNGKLNGESTSYYPGHIVALKGLYYNGLKTDVWELNDTKGKQRRSEEYDKNGHLLKSYIYLYMGTQAQKINKDQVAYFQKIGETRTTVILKNGNKLEITESLTDAIEWVDMLDFLKVTPKLYASADCILGYKNIDENTILVHLKPALDYEVIAQGDEAQLLRSLLDTSVPEE